jgi:selenocysteine lyase/cysteine desulfurase
MMISNQRHLFDIPETVAYLNTAYMSPLMHGVADAMQTGMQTKVQPWVFKPDDFFSVCKTARTLAARVFETQPHNIAMINSVSYGIQTAANNLPLKAGQEILVLDAQFPSNVYPWRDLAARQGGSLRILSYPDGGTWTEAVLGAISDKTAIIATAHMHWANGEVLDLMAVRAAADKVGAALVLDLTQSLGALPFKADEIKPDFAVAASYKWMMGPYTSAFLYVDPKWQDGRPMEFNWMNRKGSENFSKLTEYVDAYQPGALRYDMGEKANPALLGGVSAALTQVLDWGIDNIAQTLRVKTDYLADELSAIGLAPMGPSIRAPHYLGVAFPTPPPPDILASLASEDIYVSIRGDFMRVTPHLFVTDADMSRFIEQLKFHLTA